MRPIVRAIGKVLRLVGISSPEDAIRKPVAASDPPSWRKPIQSPEKPENLETTSTTAIVSPEK